MKRFLKRNFKRVLPATFRKFLKRVLFSSGNASVSNLISLNQEGDSIRCNVAGIGSFLAPSDARPDLEFHASDPTAVEELYGIACLAERHAVMFDIGAHAGLISSMFCALNETNRAFSFEPSPVSVQRLEKIRKLNSLESRMEVQPVAIGERAGSMKMIVDTVGGFVQVQLFENCGRQITTTMEVDVETMGDASKRLGVIPDIIKLDIEGYEFEAIQGAADFLKRHRPTICLELHLDYLEERKLSARTLLSILTDCGYTFREYSGRTLSAKDIYDSHLPIYRFVVQKCAQA